MTDNFEPYRAPTAPLLSDRRPPSPGSRVGSLRTLLTVPCFLAGLVGIGGFGAGIMVIVVNGSDLGAWLSAGKGIIFLVAIGFNGVAGVLSFVASWAYFRGRWRRATVCSIVGFALLGLGIGILRWFVAH